MVIQIYRAVSKTTGLSYIGQTKNLSNRILTHWYGRKSGSKFHNAMLELGRDDFEWEVLEEVDESFSDEREQYWIKYYNSSEEGYNGDTGGAFGSKNRVMCSESAQKAGVSNRGRPPWNKGKKGVSEETSRKMREGKRNFVPWNKGLRLKGA